MRRVITVLSLMFIATAASAQATRTWVSGTGSDANPCSRTAPCATFSGALAKTAAGGEIDALDPGGFGTVTITKSITIDGQGTLASILNSGGITGVIVNDASTTPGTIEVTLRNLKINGAGSPLGTDGIRFLSGQRLIVENCYIQQGSGDGIDFASTTVEDFSLSVRNTVIENYAGSGINVHPANGGTVVVDINNSWITDISASSAIILNGAGVDAAVKNTEVSRCPMGAAVAVLGGAEANLDHVTSQNNQFGVIVTGPNTAIVRLKDCFLHGTSNSVSNTVGATVTPFSSNVFVGPQIGVGASVAPQ